MFEVLMKIYVCGVATMPRRAALTEVICQYSNRRNQQDPLLHRWVRPPAFPLLDAVCLPRELPQGLPVN